MAAVPQKTLNWLFDVLKREYRDPNRSYSDLAQALSRYPGLAPRTDVYTSENGVPALLLNLKGVLPVNFRGTIYQFPISVWVPQTYPYEGPVVYVTPTDDMVVRPGQHVSAADGKVYHHYLAKWGEAWDRSNIIDFLRILADIFAKEPPVMAKPQRSQQQPLRQGEQPMPGPSSSQDQNRYSSQPPLGAPSRSGPPLPPPKQSQDNSRTGSPVSSSSRYDAPPPLPPQAQSSRPTPPPKPHGNGSVQPPSVGQNMPQRQSSLRQEYPPRGGPQQPTPPPQQYGFQVLNGKSGDQRPLPPLPPQSPTSPQTRQNIFTPSQTYPPQYQQSAPSSSRWQSQSYPQQAQARPQQPPQAPQSYLQQHQPPSSVTTVPQHQQSQTRQPPASKDLLSEDDPFQVSLSSTVQSNIPAPPIPINPEKTALLAHLSHLIIQRIHTTIDQTQTSALPSLHSQHQALTTASQNLNQEISQLKNLSSQLSSNIAALQSTIASANATIQSTSDPKHPSHPDNMPPIDQIIIPPTVVARQLYDAVAEQRGYEAAIFALNEAFVRGRIGSEVWGRKVRECAREEMRRKWLIKKIGDGLGLEEHHQ